jgi:hypothetical protein
MYLRFVVPVVHTESNRRTGVFQEIYRLMNGRELPPSEEQRAREILDWFNEHLAEPTRFAASSRPHAAPRAISWFKDNAIEHIRRMRELASILDAHGILVEVVRTARPGYIAYADEHQIIAEPFADTPH